MGGLYYYKIWDRDRSNNPYYNNPALSEKTIIEDSVKGRDSVMTEDNINKTITPSSLPIKAEHLSSHDSDNMRGFDPLSEDDEDDNGITRYMETNDDEGWD